MAKFVKLKLNVEADESVILNIDDILSAEGDTNGSEVRTKKAKEIWYVQESPEEIMKMLEAQNETT